MSVGSGALRSQKQYRLLSGVRLCLYPTAVWKNGNGKKRHICGILKIAPREDLIIEIYLAFRNAERRNIPALASEAVIEHIKIEFGDTHIYHALN